MNPISKLWQLAPLAPLAAVLLLACNKDDEGSSPTSAGTTYQKPVPLRIASAQASDVTELTDGNLFVLGNTDWGWSQATLSAKLTPGGDTIWTRNYSFGFPERLDVFGRNAVPAPDGQILLATLTSQGTQVTKLSSAGATLWRTTVPIDTYQGTARIAATTDGGCLLMEGNYYESKFKVSKLGATGVVVAVVTYTGGVGNDIRPTADGNFIVVGIKTSAATAYDKNELFLTKISPQGTVLWNQPQPGTDFGLHNTVVELPNGGYAVASGEELQPEPLQLLITDATGRKVSLTTVAPDLTGFANRLEVASDNSLILAGAQTTPGNRPANYRPLMLRLSATGSELSRKTKPTVSGSVASVVKTSNGQLVFCSTEEGKITVERTKADLTR